MCDTFMSTFKIICSLKIKKLTSSWIPMIFHDFSLWSTQWKTKQFRSESMSGDGDSIFHWVYRNHIKTLASEEHAAGNEMLFRHVVPYTNRMVKEFVRKKKKSGATPTHPKNNTIMTEHQFLNHRMLVVNLSGKTRHRGVHVISRNCAETNRLLQLLACRALGQWPQWWRWCGWMDDRRIDMVRRWDCAIFMYNNGQLHEVYHLYRLIGHGQRSLSYLILFVDW